jgi:hypothetical protein
MEDPHQSTSPLESRDSTLVEMPESSSSIAAGDHTTQSPVHRVLETTELLEKILFYLPYTHTIYPLLLPTKLKPESDFTAHFYLFNIVEQGYVAHHPV